jgi:tetratricopeptide (TPR) repeat protein
VAYPTGSDTVARPTDASSGGEERTSAVLTDGVASARREAGPGRRVLRASDPEDVFWRGYRLYWQRRYQDALDMLDAAVELRGNDARFWYYKALAERALGQDRAALESVRQANLLRQQNSPSFDLIGVALERVQGPDRRFLNGPLGPGE